jgi:hypothetical protein
MSFKTVFSRQSLLALGKSNGEIREQLAFPRRFRSGSSSLDMTWRKLGRIALIATIVAWFFLVLFGYYQAHKPFSIENALAILNVLENIGIWLALSALAGVFGHRVLRGFAFTSPLEAVVFQMGLGWGAISFATFALGLAGLLDRVLFWAFLFLGLFILRDDLLGIWKDLSAISLQVGSRFESILVLFIGATLCLAGLTALVPTLGWDAQLYHLFMGKLALAEGRIAPPPDILSLNDPSLMEMIYLAAMTLKDDGAGALLHLGYALLTLGSLVGFSTRFLRPSHGWLAGSILFAVPSFLLVSTWPYNDAALAFYAFAALYTLMVAEDKLEGRWFVLSGAFAGLALGMKYTALVVPIGLAAVLFLHRKSLSLKHWALVMIPCALAAAPWYLRNLVFVGNPIYPFFFGGKYWDSFRSQWYSHFGTGLLNEPLRLLLAPWEATVLGQEGKTSYEATIGPLLLACLPLILLAWRRAEKPRAVRELLLFASTLYVFWVAGVAMSQGLAQTRLLFPAFPALALLAGLAMEGLAALDLPQFSLARFARVLVGLVLSLTLIGQALDFVELNPLPYLFGIEPRDVFLARNLTAGYWNALQFLGGLHDTRVLFLWEPRAYYAPDPTAVQPDEILDQFPHLLYQYHDAAGIANALRGQGYTHILLSRWGMDFAIGARYAGASREDARALQELTTGFAEPVYGGAFDYSVDTAGKVHVLDVESEPYAVYALMPTRN